MAKSKNPGGRPPKFTDPDAMQAMIDAYFKDCEGTILINQETGCPVFDKFGRPVILGEKPLTVTGLAIALGFTNRQSLLNYQGKKAFQAIIERAKLRIENYAEMRLYDKDGANGARFNLQCNFRDWKNDKEEDGSRAPAINIICDIPRGTGSPVAAATNTPTDIDPQSVNDYLKALESGQVPNG